MLYTRSRLFQYACTAILLNRRLFLGRYSVRIRVNQSCGAAGCRQFLASAIALTAFAALAQTPSQPDAGRILQETRPSGTAAPAINLPPIDAPRTAKPVVPEGSSDSRVQVTQFDFSGNSALSAEVLREALKDFTGKALNFGQLIEAVEAVEARYKQAGYFLAQAILPPQQIRDGAVEISISEGLLGEIRLEGETHIATDVLFAYLDKLPKGKPLVLLQLERQILLINELAGGRETLDLQAGEKPGSSDVVLAMEPDALISGRLDANNHGALSTGEYRVGLSLNGNSLFNRGERITFNTMTSDTSGLLVYSLRGELPVGGDGWRLSASSSRATYSLGGAFASLVASGSADSLRVGAAYPLLRSRSKNLRLQLEVDRSKLKDNFRASGTVLDKQSNGVTLTTSGDWLDDVGGGGANRFDLQLRSATLRLGPTSAAQDSAATGFNTAGGFNKLQLNASRQQSLSRDMSLSAALSYQTAGKNLDSSEKLSLGGPQSLPGFGAGESSGDGGYHIKLSGRWQALPALGLSVYTDYAALKLAITPLAGATTNKRILSDFGFGADWLIEKGISANALLAWPLKPTNVPGDDNKPRLWFTLAYAW